MTDEALLRILLRHFLMWAALGKLSFGALLSLNVQHVHELVKNSVAPWTTGAILFAGCSTNFAFGAAINGYHFAIMDDKPDGRA